MWDTKRFNDIARHAMIMKTNAVHKSFKNKGAVTHWRSFKAIGKCPFCESGTWHAGLHPNPRLTHGYAIHIRCDGPDCNIVFME